MMTLFALFAFAIVFVKAVLKARRLPVSYLHDHWRDLTRLREVIASESNLTERARLLRLHRAVFGFLFASIALFAAFLLPMFVFPLRRHVDPVPPASPNPALERTPTGGGAGSASRVRPRQ